VDPQLARLLALLDSDLELAALAKISLNTARLVRRGRVLPSQPRCVASLQAFVTRNANARSRADLKLPLGAQERV
jgi:hypothetical protein